MFNMFNNYSSILSSLYNNIIVVFSYYYLCVLSCVLSLFLFYRVPYCYSPFLFCVFLLSVVFSMFVSLFFRRLLITVEDFFSSFIPVGTPIYICPLVCIAETISYIIRPVVLILRPFINVSLGCWGGLALCGLCFSSWLWGLLLFILLFYEVFVAIIHWYIVTSILSFSIEH
uniref:ATP synthase F0 subunit 6 n=1 Tax=Pseudanoplocephala crawfordi TaxID=1480107 RepID=A0A0U2PCR5_9CEST|nr:ATP synthase F0 subunit 6 [Pseudanoplocephala crawfordi]ALJ78645.1 ATP synthase F0 subunit 6 [Pseudanoplocephala crawfordi]